MSNLDMAKVGAFIKTLLPPKRIRTKYNEDEILYRKPIAVIEATLPTEISAGPGEPMRRSSRKTTIEIQS